MIKSDLTPDNKLLIPQSKNMKSALYFVEQDFIHHSFGFHILKL